MARPPGIMLAFVLVLAALGLAACGSDEGGTIPQDDADELLATLSEIEQKVEDGDCTGARTDATQLSGQIFELPKQVGVKTKTDLRDATTSLIGLIDEQCGDTDEQTTTTTTETGATGAFNFEGDG